MKKKDIWRYIHNWKGMLERHEAAEALNGTVVWTA